MIQEDNEKKIIALEEKVLELQDIENIKNLHREYLFCISNLEIDRAMDCFVDTIKVEISGYSACSGKVEVTKFFKEVIYHKVAESKDAHFTGQAVISINRNKARGHWMFYRLVSEAVSPGWVQGRYDCEYIKENDEWKFSVLQLTLPWPEFFKS